LNTIIELTMTRYRYLDKSDINKINIFTDILQI